MSFVESLADFVGEHGLSLLLGTSLLLAAVALAIAVSRSFVARRQLARLGLLATLGYLAVALVPMPRPGWETMVGAGRSAPTPAAESRRIAVVAPAPVEAAAAGERTVVGGEAPAIEAAIPRPGEERVPSITAPLVDAPAAAAPIEVAGPVAWLLLLGSGAFGVQVLLGWIALGRVLRRSRAATPALRAALGLPRTVRLRLADRDVRPFCCGLLRWCIVLPAELANDGAAARHVVRHELAHLRAGDAGWRLLTVLLRPLLFWQPLYWWLQARLRFYGEVLADDAAAGGEVGDYVRSMAAIATVSRPRLLGAPAAFVFHRRSELFRRLEMMLKRKEVQFTSTTRRRRVVHAAAAAFLVAASGAVFGVAPVAAQEPASAGETAVAKLRDENAKLRQVNADLRDRLEALERQLTGASSSDESLVRLAHGKPARYVVQQGDTLASIAKTLFLSEGGVQRLLELNPDIDPDHLRVGQELHLRQRPLPAQQPPVPAPAPTPTGGMAASRSLDDLAKVTTRLIDLRGQVQIAEIEFKRLRDQAEQNLVSKHDVEITAIALDTKRKQCGVIEKMLRFELEGASRELKHRRSLFEAGRLSASEIGPLESYVRVLQELF